MTNRTIGQSNVDIFEEFARAVQLDKTSAQHPEKSAHSVAVCLLFENVMSSREEPECVNIYFFQHVALTFQKDFLKRSRY